MPDPRPASSGDGFPAPTPGTLVRAFRARYGVTLDALAAQLGIATPVLEEYDRTGGPGWLRFALAGVAMARGTDAMALRWLLHEGVSDTADPRSSSARAGGTSPADERPSPRESGGIVRDDAPPIGGE